MELLTVVGMDRSIDRRSTLRMEGPESRLTRSTTESGSQPLERPTGGQFDCRSFCLARGNDFCPEQASERLDLHDASMVHELSANGLGLEQAATNVGRRSTFSSLATLHVAKISTQATRRGTGFDPGSQLASYPMKDADMTTSA